jgi:lysophospholipase L1-like esterase
VVLLGDSLVGGPALPGALQARLPAGSRIWAHSYQGQSVATVAGDLDVALAHDGVTDLILLAGVNDLAGGGTAEQAAKTLSALRQAATNRGVRVRLAQIPPWASHARYNARNTALLNSWIAATGGVVLTTMGDAAGRRLPAYDGGDGLHPSAAGQVELARLIAQQAFCR